ncbi:MAG: tetratricopeptide repeat protein [Marinosulfonomonas sp.]
MKYYFLAATVALAPSLGFAQDFKKGVAAFEAHNRTEAINELKPLAEQGNAAAQNYMGILSENRFGAVQDNDQALYWFQMAADQGYAEAQKNLGFMYYYGVGVPQQFREASKWYRKAAEQGLAEAQHLLGMMYRAGEGTMEMTLQQQAQAATSFDTERP